MNLMVFDLKIIKCENKKNDLKSWEFRFWNFYICEKDELKN